MTKLEAEHKLIFELSLAFYTEAYIRHHGTEWDTPEKYAAATDPTIIRDKWRAHIGTSRFLKYIARAQACIKTMQTNPELVQIILSK